MKQTPDLLPAGEAVFGFMGENLPDQGAHEKMAAIFETWLPGCSIMVGR
jgi:hypothetical protein